MMERDPLSDRMLKGEVYRMPAPPREPRREPDPDTLDVVRQAREKLYREYLRRKRATLAGRASC